MARPWIRGISRIAMAIAIITAFALPWVLSSWLVAIAADAALVLLAGIWWLWWQLPKRRMAFWGLVIISITAAGVIGFVMSGGASWAASWYGRRYQAMAPLLTLAAGVAVAGVALMRHFAQSDADRQRRPGTLATGYASPRVD